MIRITRQELYIEYLTLKMASHLRKFSFVSDSEPDDALKCLICLEVAKEPWQHDKCGRLFCKECLDKYGRAKPCPNCRTEQPQYFEDTRSMCDLTVYSVTACKTPYFNALQVKETSKLFV